MKRLCKKHKELIFLLFLFLVFGLFISFDLQAAELEIDWPAAPGGKDLTKNSTLLDLTEYIYRWSILLGGLFAFLSLIAAGFKYLSSVGNPEKVKEARNRIIAAIGGLVLLLSSYLILSTLNPELVKLTPPTRDFGGLAGGQGQGLDWNLPCKWVYIETQLGPSQAIVVPWPRYPHDCIGNGSLLHQACRLAPPCRTALSCHGIPGAYTSITQAIPPHYHDEFRLSSTGALVENPWYVGPTGTEQWFIDPVEIGKPSAVSLWDWMSCSSAWVDLHFCCYNWCADPGAWSVLGWGGNPCVFGIDLYDANGQVFDSIVNYEDSFFTDNWSHCGTWPLKQTAKKIISMGACRIDFVVGANAHYRARPEGNVRDADLIASYTPGAPIDSYSEWEGFLVSDISPPLPPEVETLDPVLIVDPVSGEETIQNIHYQNKCIDVGLAFPYCLPVPPPPALCILGGVDPSICDISEEEWYDTLVLNEQGQIVKRCSAFYVLETEDWQPSLEGDLISLGRKNSYAKTFFELGIEEDFLHMRIPLNSDMDREILRGNTQFYEKEEDSTTLLVPTTTYYYRAAARNESGVSWGETKSFKTPDITIPNRCLPESHFQEEE